METHEASGKNGGGTAGEFAVEGASEKESLSRNEICSSWRSLRQS